jgi:hypothetical protein
MGEEEGRGGRGGGKKTGARHLKMPDGEGAAGWRERRDPETNVSGGDGVCIACDALISPHSPLIFCSFSGFT